MGTATRVEAASACQEHSPRLVSTDDEYGSVREFACTGCGLAWFE